jgi:large subunit ribosomal protein L1
MGKKRITDMAGGKEAEKKRKLVKTGKEHGRITDMGAEALAEAEKIKKKETELEKLAATKKPKKLEKQKKAKPTKKRGKRYLAVRDQIDRTKFYSLSEAIKLLKKTSISRFNGAVEVHLNVREKGLKGEIKFPHPTGKNQRIKVADEKLISQLEKGKIDFDLLVASPAMMTKLVKFAKLLGPKGLMPNPKTGTISEKPEVLAKELVGKTQFRSETKAPLIHLVIGRVEAKESELADNFKTLITAIGPTNIQKAVLTTTMGPGIKVDISSL